MAEFFFEYGLFALKVITVILTILIAVAAFLILASRERDRESIEIEKINDRFDALQQALEEELLTKDERKALAKKRKKEAKLEEKKRKQAVKKAAAKEKEAQKHSQQESENENKDDKADNEAEDGTQYETRDEGFESEDESEAKEDEKEEESATKNRLFVLKFQGDMHASEVDNLRESITAILTVVKPTDEVMVMVDSPGGLVHSYGLAASQLARFRQHKIPLTVSVDLVAASGGYMMASVANKIIAAPFAIVGSIGVLAQIPNFNRFLEKYDIDIEQHTAGEYKTTLTMLGKNTDKARQKFREELEDTHQLFKKFVSEYRPSLNLEKLATGEHWYGLQALELNLIDEIIMSDDYLLNKNKEMDIYEVNYVINETFAEKLSSAFRDFSEKAFDQIFNLFKRNRLQ